MLTAPSPFESAAVDHLLEFLIGHGLSQLLGNSSQVPQGDAAGGVVVEESEDLGDILSGVLVAHTSSHHVEELFKIDASALVLVEVRDHLEDSLVLGFEPEGLHGSTELLGVDGATSVGVEQVEGFLDLLNFVFGKARALKFLSVELLA
eukprot:CAMPEP_0170493156 /NCGR_PEP_ID=MMETSP0208-20121228/13444_1 /TAXON_ID=197538 /ORGANISM="Strombidium inclinatum, Strain S3" /LENGTH=148 /DNA_ID=CAMNT_0010769039 /DNA_START=45 /DNA_END=486 /DNA_ORIENTATION=+